MLIGIDASRYGHETSTGVEKYSFYIINGLIKKAQEKKQKLVLYSRKPLRLPEELKIDESLVKFKIIPRNRFWTQIGLSQEMKKHPPGVLFVPSHTLPLKHPKKSVVTIHDVAFRHVRKPYSFFQYLYLDLSTRFAVKKAWKIIVPSECTRTDLIKFYKCKPEKIKVVHHGYEPLPDIAFSDEQEKEILNQFHIEPGEKFVFFIGRLETKKNIANVIRAFHEFSKIHKDFKLILAGKRGVGFGRILKIANKLRVWKNVFMPGYVTDAEKYVLFKNCEFFIFPSLYEGFGFPILEAFSHKKPVLTSRVSAIPEVCGEAAHYTDPFDADIMSKDMEKLAIDKSLHEKLISAGLERLSQFDWATATANTFDILTSTE